MFSDLNLTDMECCYKIFRSEIIQGIPLTENRFGFEPEIVAKVAQMRVRIYEMGVSYYGRTYEEGKKISAKDGFSALYCIFRYNAHRAPIPIQFVIYVFVGGFAAIFNLLAFLGMLSAGLSVIISAPIAFLMSAAFNYFMCISILFRHKAHWNSVSETLIYCLVVGPTNPLPLPYCLRRNNKPHREGYVLLLPSIRGRRPAPGLLAAAALG